MNLAQFKGYEKEIEQISNYINGDDYPDEIPYRIMGLFMREHKTLLAEVKRLREELKFVIKMLEEKPDSMEWYECRNLILEQVAGEEE